MKYLLTAMLLVVLQLSSMAQTPEFLNYQAVMRSADGQILSEQTIGVQISILQNTNSVYVEQFQVTTNKYGLITLKIGDGTVQSGVFADIDWSNGPYYIKIELDESLSSNYQEIGTNQLLSVPYALHAKTSENLTTESSTWQKNTDKLYYLEDNVGIGTNNPYSKLHLMGDSGNDSILLFIHNNVGGLNNSAGILFSTFPSEGANACIAAIDEYSNNGALAFYTDNDNVANYNVRERMRITKDGNIGIGNTNPTAKLDVGGDTYIGGNLTVDGSLEFEGLQYLTIYSNGGENMEASGIKTQSMVDVNSTGICAGLYIASDGNYEEADATDASKMPCTAIAIETGTGEKNVLLHGYIRNDSWSFTPGAPVYVSATAGAFTQTIPTASGQQVQIVGYATASNILYFDPDLTIIELN